MRDFLAKLVYKTHFALVVIYMVLMQPFNAHADRSSPKIAVIGAGLAGLTTAYRLQQAGLNVSLYEAHNRVGGRVLTVNINGHLAELGGQNICDGGESHHILTLIKELDLEIEEQKHILNLHYITKDQRISIKKLFQTRDVTSLVLKLETLQKTAKNMQEVLEALFKSDDPLYWICSAMLHGYEGGPPEKLAPYYCKTLFYLLTGGISAAHQSISDEEEHYYEQLLVKGGNGLIGEKIAKSLSSHLYLNHPLEKIAKNPQGSYQLTFQNGVKTTADILILAIPCGVYDNISISPEVIPVQRVEKIRSIPYGTAAKIALPVAALNEDPGSFADGKITAFRNRDNHVMNLYLIGEQGDFTAETIADRYRSGVSLIETIYQFDTSLKPKLAQNQAFASYKEPVGYSWLNDPYIKGSYSYMEAGQEELFTATTEVAGEKVKKLFSPIDNSLFFAGEHTSLLIDFNGTMEAAVESGDRTARLVQKQLDL